MIKRLLKAVLYYVMVAAGLAVLMCIIVIATEHFQDPPRHYNEAGVTFKDAVLDRTKPTATLENSNRFSVTVQCVSQNISDGAQSYGEATHWVKVLKARERREFPLPERYVSFYIYRTGSGELLGFIPSAEI